MSAVNLAFTGLYDDSIDILLQKLFQTSGLLASGIPGILQYDTLALPGKNRIDSLDHSRKYIVRNIGGDQGYIP